MSRESIYAIVHIIYYNNIKQLDFVGAISPQKYILSEYTVLSDRDNFLQNAKELRT